ncbi:golgi snare bet1-related [Anaeramoeba flamelloides]|uniref:Golgi snare bet1-related n=1 Tax=Anaeramoeba flamelloides TaxID=1746091 RepID=A0ABQ8X9N2_9EUKA|nr:golgi snare bet1-related [Anaeramoeba flamelloides]
MAFKRSRQPNNSNNKGYNHNYLQQQNQETEKQNELKIEHLKNKVIGIKSISYDIQNEIRSQNQLLDELENNFSSANSLLDRTFSFFGCVWIQFYFIQFFGKLCYIDFKPAMGSNIQIQIGNNS